MMQKKMFVFELKEGMEKEYRIRHKNIWPEMEKMLKDAGVENYSIWLWQGKIFGYYESRNMEETCEYKKNNNIQKLWNQAMESMIQKITYHGEEIPEPECVFYLP